MTIELVITTQETMVTGYGVIITPESWKSFQQLIQRGANLWPDAPPEIKEFADLVTNGEVLQDYKSQDTSQKKSD